MIRTLSGRLALAAAAIAALGGCNSVRSTFGLERNPPDEFAVVSRAPLTLPPDFSLPPPSPGALRPQESTPSQQAASALFGAGQQPRMDMPGATAYSPPVSSSAAGSPRPYSPSLPPGPGSSGARTPGQSATAASRAGANPNALQTPATGPAQAMPARRGFARAQTRQPTRPSYPASSGESALLSRAGADRVDSSIRQTVNQETAGLLLANRTTVERLLGLAPRANDSVVNPREESARLRQNAATGAPVTQGETPTIARRRKGILEGIF